MQSCRPAGLTSSGSPSSLDDLSNPQSGWYSPLTGKEASWLHPPGPSCCRAARWAAGFWLVHDPDPCNSVAGRLGKPSSTGNLKI